MFRNDTVGTVEIKHIPGRVADEAGHARAGNLKPIPARVQVVFRNDAIGAVQIKHIPGRVADEAGHPCTRNL